jgi:hypothetical protein
MHRWTPLPTTIISQIHKHRCQCNDKTSSPSAIVIAQDSFYIYTIILSEYQLKRTNHRMVPPTALLNQYTTYHQPINIWIKTWLHLLIFQLPSITTTTPNPQSSFWLKYYPERIAVPSRIYIQEPWSHTSLSNITYHNRPHLLATRDCNHAAGDFPSSLAKGNTTNVLNLQMSTIQYLPPISTLCVVYLALKSCLMCASPTYKSVDTMSATTTNVVSITPSVDIVFLACANP